MMRGLVALIALALLATDATSEPVIVKSGEHGAYTRLVATVPAGTDWRLDQYGHVATLTVELGDVDFDLSGVFSRISRERLAELKQDDPGAPLQLELACDCVVRSFLHAGTMIVMDIAPGEVPRNAAVSLPQGPPVLAGAIDEDERNTGAPPLLPLVPAENELKHLFVGLETEVMSRLIRGADQQVLDLNLARIGPRNTIRANIEQNLPWETELANIVVSTALDREPDVNSTDGRSIGQLRNCFGDNDFGFETWNDGSLFSNQIASSRVLLFSEFDRVNSDQVLKLARAYAYFGFGAEAVHVLNLAGADEPDHRFIRAVASVTEGLPLPTPHPFSYQQGCDTSLSLWGLLADGYLADDANLSAIELAFARLPPHLRSLFSDDLVATLTKAGRLEAARRVLRLMEGSGKEEDGQLALAKAGLARAAGAADSQDALLTTAVESKRQIDAAPVALIELIEKRWAEGAAVTEHEVELAASFALQYRRSELGHRLVLAHIVALALSNQFNQSFAALSEADWARNAPEVARAFEQVAAMLVERGDDIAFLRHVFGFSAEQITMLSDQTVSDTAERLTELGFANAAAPFAGQLGQRRDPTRYSMTLARVSQGTGQPHRSLWQLDGEESDAAQQLRVRAYSDTGDIDRAVEILKQLGDAETAARLLWLSENWKQAQEMDAGKYSGLAGMAIGMENTVQPADGPPLASAKSLLAASQQTRAEISGMLAALENN